MVSYIRGDDNFDSANTGASTTYGDVGTYVFAFSNGTKFSDGATLSGSGLYPAAMTTTSSVSSDDYATFQGSRGGSSLSGTWRAMGRNQTYWSHSNSLFVRIS